jgi:cold shock CspA family protein
MALTGNVSRWFNRKGYGFINVMTSDSEHVGSDLFVHLSGVNVSNDGYKCLYPGEYVSFDLGSGKDGRPTCVNVTGVLGGPLLIEHSEYRYKYFQKNPDNRRDSITDNEPTVDEAVGATDEAVGATDEAVGATDEAVDENDPETQ